MKIHWLIIRLIPLILLAFLSGCWGGGRPSTFTLSGRIVDSQNMDIEVGIEQVALYFSGDTSINQTDDSGNWRQTGLRGRVKVTPALDGWVFYPKDRTYTSSARNVNFYGSEILSRHVNHTQETIITSKDTKATLIIPANGLSQDTTITVHEALIDTQTALRKIYDFGPATTQFSHKASITINYDGLDLAPDNIYLGRYVNGSWELLSTVVDDGNRTATAQINQLGAFAIISRSFSLSGSISVEHDFPKASVDMAQATVMTSFPTNVTIASQEEYIPKQMIIGFNSWATPQERGDIINRLKAKVVSTVDALNAVVVEIPDNTPQSAIWQILDSPQVRFMEPNMQVVALSTKTPNDPYFPSQWHYSQIRLPQAWSVTTGNPWIRVAILDTGCDPSHPDLVGNLDLINGYNFVDHNQDTSDVHGHGTHVAGTVGAVSNNGIGVSGVMWQCELVPVKVLNNRGNGTFVHVAEGILYAAGLHGSIDNPYPVDVINLSLGFTSTSQLVHDAIRAAAQNGQIIVAAAGNENSNLIKYPAAYPEVIAVGAVNYNYPHTPQRAEYSNFGPELDLVAPGGDTKVDSDGDGNNDGILSTDINNKYSYMQGTSMAAPHISGVIGLMLSAGIPHANIREVLRRTAMDLGNPGPNDDFGHGLVNAYWAVSNVDKIIIGLGNWQDNTFHAIEWTTTGIGDGNYHFSEVSSGTYQVVAFVDVRRNGYIDPGDYFAQSEPMFFEPENHHFLDLSIKEVGTVSLVHSFPW